MEVTALAAMPFAQTTGPDRGDQAFAARSDHAGIGHTGQSGPLIAQAQSQDGASNDPNSERNPSDPEAQKSPMVLLEEKAQEAFDEPNLEFNVSYNKDIEKFVFEAVDPNSGDVVKQYPDVEFMSRLRAFQEVTGLTVDSEA